MNSGDCFRYNSFIMLNVKSVPLAKVNFMLLFVTEVVTGEVAVEVLSSIVALLFSVQVSDATLPLVFVHFPHV